MLAADAGAPQVGQQKGAGGLRPDAEAEGAATRTMMLMILNDCLLADGYFLLRFPKSLQPTAF